MKSIRTMPPAYRPKRERQRSRRTRCFIVALAVMAPGIGFVFAGGALQCDADPWAPIVQELAAGRDVNCTYVEQGIAYLISAHRPDVSLTASIIIGRPGVLLDRAKFNRAYAAATDVERRRDFPPDGARSMIDQIVFGPGGGSSTIVSSTFDERYDLRLTVIDGGSVAARPDETYFDVVALNRRLHRAYWTTAK